MARDKTWLVAVGLDILAGIIGLIAARSQYNMVKNGKHSFDCGTAVNGDAIKPLVIISGILSLVTQAYVTMLGVTVAFYASDVHKLEKIFAKIVLVLSWIVFIAGIALSVLGLKLEYSNSSCAIPFPSHLFIAGLLWFGQGVIVALAYFTTFPSMQSLIS
ncbi:unnamed protein product [Cuscuta epithymum]|uniref:CASP-like protein n=1 Tax=Cuscuta epithymum TaxID=186058 RepID=A0AAV0DNH7_9ASTE|nr:unnamed protein product [Cuscuta epithymum]